MPLRASPRPPGDRETGEQVPALTVPGRGVQSLQNHDQSGPGPWRQGQRHISAVGRAPQLLSAYSLWRLAPGRPSHWKGAAGLWRKGPTECDHSASEASLWAHCCAPALLPALLPDSTPRPDPPLSRVFWVTSMEISQNAPLMPPGSQGVCTGMIPLHLPTCAPQQGAHCRQGRPLLLPGPI